jgi:hypothetical protein
VVARPLTGRRRHVLAGIVTAAATLAASGVLLGLSPAAHATGADNDTVLAHLNALRERHGLHALVESSDLMSIAAAHSVAMSKTEGIFHNPDLTSEVANWEVLGENVGMGGSASDIDVAFDNSPDHYANEVGAAYTQVGIGTASDSRGYLYITVDFRKPMYVATPAPAKAPVKAPVLRPAKPTPVTVLARKALTRSLGTGESAAAQRLADRLAAQRADVAEQAAVDRARQARVAAVRAAAADQTAGTGSDPVGRALSFSRTLTALAG